MAAHRKRTGHRLVCWRCKCGDHAVCVNTGNDGPPAIVCHCDCQPDCGRPDCAGKPRQVY